MTMRPYVLKFFSKLFLLSKGKFRVTQDSKNGETISSSLFPLMFLKAIHFVKSVCVMFSLWNKIFLTKPFQASQSWHQLCRTVYKMYGFYEIHQILCNRLRLNWIHFFGFKTRDFCCLLDANYTDTDIRISSLEMLMDIDKISLN